MDRLKETLYDILDVPRDAKANDIARAYQRHRATMRADTTPPDPRRAALLHEAYEVLSDPQRREAYDASLRRGGGTVALSGRKAFGPGATAAMLVLAALGVIVALLIVNRPAARKPEKLLKEIQTEASLAVGRLQSIDLSGKAESVGVAFTLEPGVMMAPCAGLTPNAQLTVVVPTRRIPARLTGADRSGRFCRLEVSGGGSWPLTMKSIAPNAGEKVYAADVGPNGEVVLREGTVKSVRQGSEGRIVDTSLAIGPDSSGRPLLDTEGRVVAVAMVAPGGKAQHVGVPTDWIESGQPRGAPVPRTPEPEAESKNGSRRPPTTPAQTAQ